MPHYRAARSEITERARLLHLSRVYRSADASSLFGWRLRYFRIFILRRINIGRYIANTYS